MISPSRMIARARHSDAAKQAHRLVRREGGTGRKSCLAPTEYERARAAAAERGHFLRAILEKGLNGVVGNHQILPGIRELPPQLSAEQRQLAEQRQETEQCQLVEERGVGYGVAAHLARFRWQMESPELLLMGRVCDAVHYFLMSRSAMTVRQQCSDNPGLLGRIYLEDLSYSDIPASLFPWLVVIETYFPDLFDSFFKQHRDWLAIGIAFDEPREFSAYGSCAAGGSEGEAGGQVRVSGLDLHADKTSMVTCAHILPTNCQHLLHIWRDQDIALLKDGSPCFFKSTSLSFPVTAVSREDLKSILKGKQRLCFGRFTNQRPKGWPIDVGMWINGCEVEVPHVCIAPSVKMFVWDLIAWPFWWTNFAKPGDSGSWILIEHSNKWVGMIIGGRDFNRYSIAICAYYLLTFIGYEMEMKEGGGLRIEPLAFVET